MTDEEIYTLVRGDFLFDIPNFKKWNPDIEGKRSWFKLNIHWNDDPKFWKVSPLARLLWLDLITFRAQGCQNSIINARLLTTKCHIRTTSLYKLLPILLKLQLIDLQKERKKEKKDEEEGNFESSTTFLFPKEFKNKEFLEIKNRRKISDRGLIFWLEKSPNPQWLLEKIQKLDLEADSHSSHQQKPFIQRLNEYLTKHLGYEKKAGVSMFKELEDELRAEGKL